MTTLLVGDIGATVTNVTWPGTTPLALEASLALPTAGRVTLKGTATLRRSRPTSPRRCAAARSTLPSLHSVQGAAGRTLQRRQPFAGRHRRSGAADGNVEGHQLDRGTRGPQPRRQLRAAEAGAAEGRRGSTSAGPRTRGSPPSRSRSPTFASNATPPAPSVCASCWRCSSRNRPRRPSRPLPPSPCRPSPWPRRRRRDRSPARRCHPRSRPEAAPSASRSTSTPSCSRTATSSSSTAPCNRRSRKPSREWPCGSRGCRARPGSGRS